LVLVPAVQVVEKTLAQILQTEAAAVLVAVCGGYLQTPTSSVRQ
jgi:hypothetical protein